MGERLALGEHRPALAGVFIATLGGWGLRERGWQPGSLESGHRLETRSWKEQLVFREKNTRMVSVLHMLSLNWFCENAYKVAGAVSWAPQQQRTLERHRVSPGQKCHGR